MSSTQLHPDLGVFHKTPVYVYQLDELRTALLFATVSKPLASYVLNGRDRARNDELGTCLPWGVKSSN